MTVEGPTVLPRPRSPRWRSAVAVAGCLALSGCGSPAPTPVELGGLDREYLSVGDADTLLVLSLGEDGSFAVTERAGDCGEDNRMRPEPEPLARGEWSFVDGALQLVGDGWTAFFAPDSTRVEVPRRADTLACLRWVRSTEGSPFSACELVSASQFHELLHPTEGSGSSGF